MDEKIITFVNEIEKFRYPHQKILILMDDVDIGKVILSNKVSCKKCYKYFVGYKDDENVNPQCIIFHKWVGVQKVLMKLNVCLFW